MQLVEGRSDAGQIDREADSTDWSQISQQVLPRQVGVHYAEQVPMNTTEVHRPFERSSNYRLRVLGSANDNSQGGKGDRPHESRRQTTLLVLCIEKEEGVDEPKIALLTNMERATNRMRLTSVDEPQSDRMMGLKLLCRRR